MSQQNKKITDRECTRIPKGVHIKVKKLEYPFSKETGETGTTRNIAKQGVCFITATRYSPGETLSLDITLNGWRRHRKGLTTILSDKLSEADTLTVIAEVMWAKTSAENNRYDTGVKFINVYEDDMVALEKYFSSILPDS